MDGEERRQNNGVMLQILTRIEAQFGDLKDRLYDKDGDIPAIKKQLIKMNGGQARIKIAIAVLFVLVLGGTGVMKIAGLL